MNHPRIHTYTLLVRPVEERAAYRVEAPALPGCTGLADTLEEAVMRAYAAILSRLEAMCERNEPLPDEREEGWSEAAVVRVHVTEPLPVIR